MVQLTNFYPHVQIGTGSGHRPEWSNDGLDSCIGFKGIDFSFYPAGDAAVLYRLNLSAAMIENSAADPALTTDDPLVQRAVTASTGNAVNLTQHDWAPLTVANDQVVYEHATGGTNSELHISDLTTGDRWPVAVVNGGHWSRGIRWSPDGTQIIWGDQSDIGIVNTDGSGQGLFLDGSAGNAYSFPFWSLDGNHIACMVLRFAPRKGKVSSHWNETFVLTGIADGIPVDIPTPFGDLLFEDTPKELIDWVSDNLAE